MEEDKEWAPNISVLGSSTTTQNRPAVGAYFQTGVSLFP